MGVEVNRRGNHVDDPAAWKFGRPIRKATERGPDIQAMVGACVPSRRYGLHGLGASQIALESCLTVIPRGKGFRRGGHAISAARAIGGTGLSAGRRFFSCSGCQPQLGDTWVRASPASPGRRSVMRPMSPDSAVRSSMTVRGDVIGIPPGTRLVPGINGGHIITTSPPSARRPAPIAPTISEEAATCPRRIRDGP
jgi:hypothetical protein